MLLAATSFASTLLSAAVEVHLPPPCTLTQAVEGVDSPLVTCASSLPQVVEVKGKGRRGGCSEGLGVAENFEFVRELNSGNYGSVLLMSDREGRPVAVKEVIFPEEQEKREKWLRMVDKEVKVAYLLGSVSPSHFVTLHLAFNFENGSCLVFEKLEEDLFDAAGSEEASLLPLRDSNSDSIRFPENAAREIVSQLLEGLHKSHGAGIELGDLKLENVMLDRPVLSFLNNGGKVKMVDFGSTKMRKQAVDQGETFAIDEPLKGATLGYFPPTFLLAGEKKMFFHVDLYATGVTLLRLLAGSEFLPRFSTSESQEWEVEGTSKILKRKTTFKLEGVQFKDSTPAGKMWSFPFPSFVMSEYAEEVIRTLLNPHRFTSAREILNMPWFSKTPQEIKSSISERVDGRNLPPTTSLTKRLSYMKVRKTLLPFLDSDFDQKCKALRDAEGGKEENPPLYRLIELREGPLSVIDEEEVSRTEGMSKIELSSSSSLSSSPLDKVRESSEASEGLPLTSGKGGASRRKKMKKRSRHAVSSSSASSQGAAKMGDLPMSKERDMDTLPSPVMPGPQKRPEAEKAPPVIPTESSQQPPSECGDKGEEGQKPLKRFEADGGLEPYPSLIRCGSPGRFREEKDLESRSFEGGSELFSEERRLGVLTRVSERRESDRFLEPKVLPMATVQHGGVSTSSASSSSTPIPLRVLSDNLLKIFPENNPSPPSSACSSPRGLIEVASKREVKPRSESPQERHSSSPAAVRSRSPVFPVDDQSACAELDFALMDMVRSGNRSEYCGCSKLNCFQS